MTEVAGQHLSRGTMVSRYEIRDVLGSGGFGITYKVFDTRLHCEAAMKEYLPADLAVRADDGTTVMPRSRDLAGEYGHGLTRFLDEARTLARFKNRHIVRVSDYMELNGTAYLIMDYEDGRPLGDLLKQRGGPLSEVEIKDIFIPILDGLKTVHDAGLLHRDIKPDNVYLRRDGPPVLLDFGAARQYTADQTRNVTTIVTPGYAPFEQYQVNGALGAWTDLYALGATMYACISGHPPVDAITRHGGNTADPLPPAVEIGQDRYSEVLLRTIDWMLRTSVSERPQSVEEVLPCIQGRVEPPERASRAVPQSAAPTVRLSESEARAASPELPTDAATSLRTPPEPAPEADRSGRSGSGRRSTVMVGTALAIFIAAGAAWWYIRDHGDEPRSEETVQKPVAPVQRAESPAGTGAEENPAGVETGSAPQMEQEAPGPAPPEGRADSEVEVEVERASTTSIADTPDADESTIADPGQAGESGAGSGQPVEDTAVQSQPASIDDPPGTAETRMTETQEAGASSSGGGRIAEDAAGESPTASADDTPGVAEPRIGRTEQDDPAGTGQLAGDTGQALPADTAGTPDSDDTGVVEPRQGDEPDTGTGRVTEDVDEFLAALLIESSQSDDDGEAAAPTAQGSAAREQAREDLEQLLMEAEAYLAASSLVAPEGRNARMIYQKILAVDPDNPEALAGMNRIAAVYEKAAGIMMNEGRTVVSRRIVARGLEAVPGHAGLLQLQARLEGQ
jgi:serine/threonine protein kinase